MPPSTLLKPARLLHLYLGVFTAPALIFFAFTGAIQTFSLHETTRGRDYTPPKILVELAQLHKKQTLVLPPRKPQPAPTPRSSAAPSSTAQPSMEAASPGKPRSETSPEARPSDARPSDARPSDARPSDARPSTSAPREARSGTDAVPSTPRPADASPTKAKNLLPTKIFFLIVAVALLLSTITGVYMSYKFARNKTITTLVLLAGIVVPVLLILL